MRLPISSYNPLSANADVRRTAILRELGRSHIVCLQGTARRHSGEQCAVTQYAKHQWYDWGAQQGCQHKAEGVGIVLAKRVFKEHNVSRVFHPPPEYRGRFGALRIQRGDVDACIICVYMFTEPQKSTQQQRNLRFWKYVESFIQKLPARCMPVLCMDGNAHVGLTRGPGGQMVRSDCDGIGSFKAELQNFNGGCMANLLSSQFLAAVNSFYDVGSTYYGPPPRRHSTRIDYICVPCSALSRVSRCHVQYGPGDRLQLICDLGRRDHFPLQIEIDVALRYDGNGGGSQTRWDTNKMVHDALHGSNREQLFQVVDRELSKILPMVQCSLPNPDVLWDAVSKSIRTAAGEVYVTGTKKMRERPADTTSAIEDMLQAKSDMVQFRPLLLGNRAVQWDGESTLCLQQALHDLFWGWKKISKFHSLRKQVDKFTKRDALHTKTQLVSEFHYAWSVRDMHQVWTLSRVLSGRKLGPKRRRYDAARSVRPGVRDWVKHLQLVGPEGGCSATEVKWEEIQTLAMSNDQQCLSIEDALPLVRTDLRDIKRQVRRSKLRKSVAPWAIPTEVWRQLLLPSWQWESKRHGVGFAVGHHFSTHVQFVLFRMLLSVRVYGRAPAMWQRSQAIELDKKNNKPGPAGIRLINNLEVFGKWFFSALWKRGTSHAQRYYASGYVPGKSRIDPIMQQAVLHHRLRHHRISHALSLYDIANAFPSPTRQALSRVTRNVAQPSDLDLLQQRHSYAYMSITARDGAVCLQPGSGGLQGDAVACEQFLEVYHPILDRWWGETQQEELVVADPVSGVAVDVSLTGYADDVARCTVAETSEEMHMLLTNANDVLEQELQTAGMQQNIDKQEHVVFFAGRYTREYNLHVYRDGMLPGRTKTAARYLGSLQHFKGNNSMEIEARQAAASQGYYAMGKFWATVTLRRPANVVFQAMVRGAALSGLEALVLTDTECARLDSTILRFARKLLRGAACHKTHTDGGVLYRAVPDSDVCRLLRIVPSKLELTIRRLQYWQAVARRPDSHSAVLAAVFGTMRYDARDTLCADGSIADSANPWALQFAEDVASLLVLDTASERLWGIGHRFFLVFTSYRHDFLQIDCSELRAAFFSIHIPPPGTSPPNVAAQTVVDLPVDDAGLVFVCDCADMHGNPCTAYFRSQQALAMHIRCTTGGTHGHVHDHVRAAICNQCPFCKHIFASVRVAQNHIRNSLRNRRCTGAGSSTHHVVLPPCNMLCPFCEVEGETLEAVYACIATHLPRIPT